MDEKGYIKFNCKWVKSEPISYSELMEINKWRDKLYGLGLIGVYDNGIGFGNISIRIGDLEQFIITGSATGSVKSLDGRHYTRVVDFDLGKNSLTCEGPIKASSESLTHAAIYRIDSKINAVIHIHNLDLWKRLIGRVPTTSGGVEYGTPEMAREVVRLFRETDVRNKRILVMGGHREGIVSFGSDLNEAGEIILSFL